MRNGYTFSFLKKSDKVSFELHIKYRLYRIDRNQNKNNLATLSVHPSTLDKNP
jgi:hypothetical protein